MKINLELSVMMAKRKIKTLTELSNLSGLSRTTLTALYHGKAKGIQFETLVKLCQVLNCQVNDIIEIEEIDTIEAS